jgi:serine/threonine protein phosphatase PrpC
VHAIFLRANNSTKSVMEAPSGPLQFATLTHAGRVRRFNEDAVAADQEFGIAVVADGMGRNRAGEVASRMARDIVLTGLRAAGSKPARKPAQAIQQVLDKANRSIFKAASENPVYRGMGSTLALLYFGSDRVSLAHVGDSRVYRLREGRLTLLTRDDSLLSDLVESGLISAQEAGGSRNRHLVTQALGIQEKFSMRLHEEDLRPSDVFLVCSDGLSDMVDESDIELIVNSLHMNLPLAARHLVQLANDNGGLDNVSVVLVKVNAAAAAPRYGGGLGRLRRLLRWLR